MWFEDVVIEEWGLFMVGELRILHSGGSAATKNSLGNITRLLLKCKACRFSGPMDANNNAYHTISVGVKLRRVAGCMNTDGYTDKI